MWLSSSFWNLKGSSYSISSKSFFFNSNYNWSSIFRMISSYFSFWEDKRESFSWFLLTKSKDFDFQWDLKSLYLMVFFYSIYEFFILIEECQLCEPDFNFYSLLIFEVPFFIEEIFDFFCLFFNIFSRSHYPSYKSFSLVKLLFEISFFF